MAANPEPTKPNNVTAIATTDNPQLTRPVLGLPTPAELATMESLGQMYQQSGLLPKGIGNWQAAVISIQAGRELGIPPTVAIREIYVVNGRPTCSAQLMMSLIRRTYGGQAIRVKDSTNESCTIEYREPGWDGVSTFTFTIEDAKRAKLAGKDTWTSYPRAMLRSRAVSEVARSAFPDCISGMYTPEELNAPVDEEGRIIITGEIIDHDTGEITVHEPAPVDPAKVMRRLHAVAKNAGIGHDLLHGWAVSKGAESLRDVPAAALDSIASKIDGNPAEAAEWFAQYAPGNDAAQTELINDPELHAQADRDLAAAKARA